VIDTPLVREKDHALFSGDFEQIPLSSQSISGSDRSNLALDSYWISLGSLSIMSHQMWNADRLLGAKPCDAIRIARPACDRPIVTAFSVLAHWRV
jgi:hypothetical protein